MPDPSRRFLARGAAGTAATLITYPFDIVRARMTVDPNSKHMLETARTIVREGGGFRSLYNGLFPTLASVIPFVGLQQSTYDVVKAKAMDKNGFGMRPSAVLFRAVL